MLPVCSNVAKSTAGVSLDSRRGAAVLFTVNSHIPSRTVLLILQHPFLIHDNYTVLYAETVCN